MPRAKGPGRPRKFKMGDVVYGDTPNIGHVGVVVDYKATPKDSYYRVVSIVDRKARWLSSTVLNATGRSNLDVLRIYRANERLADRECEAHCCVHQAIPRRNWRDDVDG